MLAAAASAIAGDWEARAAEIRTRMAALSSADELERNTAAARLVEMQAEEEVARGGASLDGQAWKAFADACIAKSRGLPAPRLNAAAYSAPEAHRRRLLDLAHRLDPRVGIVRTPKEIEATVRASLVDERTSSDEVERIGHEAVPFIVAVLRNARKQRVDSISAAEALRLLAEPEDVPALRELLLAGNTFMARPLGTLQERGVTEAASALIDAVDAGRFDFELAPALARSPQRTRAIKSVRAWIDRAGPQTVSGLDRASAASVFEALDARESVPLLESWIATSEDSTEFWALASALTGLGSKQGVALLIRIVSEKRAPGTYRPTTDADRAADRAAGRLPCGGFISSNRWSAAWRLCEVSGGVVKVPTQEQWLRGCDLANEAGIPEPSEDDFLDKRAAAFRKWWDESKDKLTFDVATGQWSVGK